MSEPSLSELAALQSALADYDTKTGIRNFCVAQAMAMSSRILEEVRKPSPDHIKMAQFAGRLDVYETFLAELGHYVKNRI